MQFVKPCGKAKKMVRTVCGRAAGPGAGGRRSLPRAGSSLWGAPNLDTAAQPEVGAAAPASVALGATASSHPAGPAGASGDRRAAPPLPSSCAPRAVTASRRRSPGAQPQTQRSHSRPHTQETAWGHAEMLIT